MSSGDNNLTAGANSAYNQRCMVCDAQMEYLFSKTFNSLGLTSLEYDRCVDCGFVACATLLKMPRDDWEYLNFWFHSAINSSDADPYDRSGRLEGQAEVIDHMLNHGLISRSAPMLDWGSGTGDLADRLRDRGRTLFSYDQYIEPKVNPLPIPQPLPAAYALVTATAVFEHLTHRSQLDAIEALVADDGVLGIHLLIPREVPVDPNWVYLLPVHCAFHNWESMRRLMIQWGYEASVYCDQARMWLFFKSREGVREKVEAINAAQKCDYLLYCEGFVSANGVMLPLDPGSRTGESKKAGLYIGMQQCKLPSNWTFLLLDVEGQQLIDETWLAIVKGYQFDYVYSDMVAERMSKEQFAAYLQWVRGLLKPGGSHRLVTTDLKRVLDNATSGAWSGFAWVKKAHLNTAAEYLNTVFRSWGHKYLYDEESLIRCFVQADYQDVQITRMMEGCAADLYIFDRDKNRLFIEGRC